MPAGHGCAAGPVPASQKAPHGHGPPLSGGPYGGPGARYRVGRDYEDGDSFTHFLPMLMRHHRRVKLEDVEAIKRDLEQIGQRDDAVVAQAR